MGMTVEDKSILQTFVINFVLALIVWIIFLFIRPKFPKAYRNRESENLETPASGDGFFAWIMPTMRYPEDKILVNHGVDCVMYLRYIRTFVFFFAGCLVLAFIVIVPVNATASNRNQPKEIIDCSNETEAGGCLFGPYVPNPLYVQGLPIISVANINPNRNYPGHGHVPENVRLVAHLIMTYVFTAGLFFLLYRDWAAFARYRVAQRRLPTLIQNFSVFVLDCPVDVTDSADAAEKTVFNYFDKMFPGKVAKVVVAWDAPKIRARIAKWNEAVIKYEKAEAANYAKGKRPTHKTGFLGLWGDKVDSIDYWKEQKEKWQNKVTAAQNTRSKYKLTRCAIVTFTDQHSAAAAAATSLSDTSAVWASYIAPEPRDVFWTNLGVSDVARTIRGFIAKLITFLLVFFWSIPVLFAASLANIDRISQNKKFRWLHDVVYFNTQIGTFIAGFLPVLVVIIFFALLLLIIRLIAKIKKPISGTLVDRAVRNYYFAFQFVNILLVYTLSGSFFLNSKDFLNSISFKSIVNLIAVSVPPQAQFFSNYVMTAAMLGQALGILRPAAPILHWAFGKWLCKTERDFKNLYATPCFNFAAPYSTTALIFCITIIYSLLNPFILIWGLLYFATHYVVCRYNFLHVFRVQYDSAASLWPSAFYHMTVGIIFFQLVMFGLLLAYGFYASAAVLPLVPLTLLFYSFVTRRFQRPVEWGALDTLTVSGGSAPAAAAAGDGKAKAKGDEVEMIALRSDAPGESQVFESNYDQPERQPLKPDQPVDLRLPS